MQCTCPIPSHNVLGEPKCTKSRAAKSGEGPDVLPRMLRRWAILGTSVDVSDKQAHKDCWNQVLQEEIDGSLPSLEELEAFRVDSLDP